MMLLSTKGKTQTAYLATRGLHKTPPYFVLFFLFQITTYENVSRLTEFENICNKQNLLELQPQQQQHHQQKKYVHICTEIA
jgi:hypothetical protein